MGSNAEEFPPQDDEITVFVTGFGVCINPHLLPVLYRVVTSHRAVSDHCPLWRAQKD